MNDYYMRSLLFVPGHNEKLLASAAKTDADALLLDIEDSVQPASNKAVARQTIKKWIESNALKDHLVFPRVNDRESGFLLQDIYELTIPGVHGFMYPKSMRAEDVYFVDKLLDTIEFEKGFAPGTFKLIPLIETASAVLNAENICRASNRVIAIAFGAEDFIASLEGIHDKEGISILTPRAMIAMAARATGVIPIDTVHIDVHNLEDLEENLILAKKLGFECAMALHPKELPLLHKYYSLTDKEVAEAEEMLSLAEAAKKDGRGVAILNGKFIGPPMVSTAKKILKKSEMMKKKQKS